ncbi:MAG TPA: GIY-YIG nuclease family protein [Perlabentimonas sp.]|nr:GIY-YIG nuclease family protein [Bacteroidales bacterium]MDY0349559.1 GIY-YIG nuclease family protein [Tenuifilaceae bacterium]HZJ74613.1 GIY-YIG nuclease family protein [Perlabentimonas sp.]
MYFTYIIYSQSHDMFFKGFTTEPDKTLELHNYDMNHVTANKGPWILMYLKEHSIKKQALTEKRRISRLSHKSILELINSSDNIAPPVE